MSFTMKDMKSGFGFWVLGFGFWVLSFELMKLTIFLFFVTENLCIRPNVFYHEGREGNEGLKDETFQAVFQDF